MSVQSVSESDAARFLNQATLGATTSEIARVSRLGPSRWITLQFALPTAYDAVADPFAKSYLEHLISLAIQIYPDQYEQSAETYLETNDYIFNATGNKGLFAYQMGAWFNAALLAPGQLRQRMAYALSQIIVVSEFDNVYTFRSEALASYYDVLARNAFGNYRVLLSEIARHPAMGVYLTFHGNKKASEDGKVVPDENFARELMQLFTVGLYDLQMDGTPKRDGAGRLIPTYTQDDVESLARVFTGWDMKNNAHYGDLGDKFYTGGDYTSDMEFTAEYHDFGSKTLLGQTIPANLDGEEDVRAALDILFGHANVAPFISTLLIKRLTSSNPSAAYIQRVASVFENNGQGVKGDLKAVLQAILLDPEARLPDEQKFKEPFLCFTQLLRAMDVQPLAQWENSLGDFTVTGFSVPDPGGYTGQAPTRSPSVFNFYLPDFIPADPQFLDANLSAPEFQIQSELMMITYFNTLERILRKLERTNLIRTFGSMENYETVTEPTPEQDAYVEARQSWKFTISFSEELERMERAIDGDANGDFSMINSLETGSDGQTPKARGVDALIEYLDGKLTAHQLSDAHKMILKRRLMAMEVNDSSADAGFLEAHAVIREALLMIVTSGVYTVQ